MSGVLYHIAPYVARDVIVSEGLIPATPNPRWAKYGVAEQPAGVYAWETYGRALAWARDFQALYQGARIGWCDVWRVDVRGIGHSFDPILGLQGARVIHGAVSRYRVALALAGPVAKDVA